MQIENHRASHDIPASDRRSLRSRPPQRARFGPAAPLLRGAGRARFPVSRRRALRSPGGLARGPDRGPFVQGLTLLPCGARSTGNGPRSYVHCPSIGIRMARPTTTGPGPARQGNPCRLFFVTVSRGVPPRHGRAACGHDAGADPLADTSSGDRFMRLLTIAPAAGAVAGSRRRSRWTPSRVPLRRPAPGGRRPRPGRCDGRPS